MERIAPVPEEIAAELEKGRIYPSPVYEVTPFVVHIGAGEYREKLVLSRPNVTFLGEGRDKTVLVFGDGANEIEEDGEKRGTFRTATLRIDTPDFTARHLTFQNDAGYGHTVGQALALYVDGDRCYFEDCAMLGSQDTLFDAPLPLDPVKPNGKGPGEHKPRIRGRHLYRNCFCRGMWILFSAPAPLILRSVLFFQKARGPFPGGQRYLCLWLCDSGIHSSGISLWVRAA